MYVLLVVMHGMYGAGTERETRGGCMAGLVLTGQSPSRIAGELDYTFSRAHAADATLTALPPTQSTQQVGRLCAATCHKANRNADLPARAWWVP